MRCGDSFDVSCGERVTEKLILLAFTVSVNAWHSGVFVLGTCNEFRAQMDSLLITPQLGYCFAISPAANCSVGVVCLRHVAETRSL